MAASLTLIDPPARRLPRRRLLRWSVVAAAAVIVIWGVGFGRFLCLASHEGPSTAHADAIVALTGGPDRVEVALRLLSNGAAAKLLISGAGEKTDLGILAQHAGINPAPLERLVTLGHAAHSTRGNAFETASWMHDHEVHSILLVTAWFHMPRAMIELRRVMPEVKAYPYPVGQFNFTELGHAGVARRLIVEYHKYLAALAGLTAWPLLIEVWGMEPIG